MGRALLLGAIVVAGLSPSPEAQVPSSCPVTVAADSSFTPPSPYPARPYSGRFWYGTPALWTSLAVDGVWRGVPPTAGYRRGHPDKVFWWQPGFDGRREPRPALSVTARRLDGDAPPAYVDRATNAYHVDFGGWTMLTGVDLPTLGCWEITGQYGGASLTFVVWIAP